MCHLVFPWVLSQLLLQPVLPALAGALCGPSAAARLTEAVTRVYSTLSSTTDTALLPSLVCAMWFMLSGVLVRGDRRNRLVEGLGDVVS